MESDIDTSWQHIGDISLSEYELDDLEITLRDSIDTVDILGSDLTGNLTWHIPEYTEYRNKLDNIFAADKYICDSKTTKYVNKVNIYNTHDVGFYTLERLAKGK